jgi:hypothetical protein
LAYLNYYAELCMFGYNIFTPSWDYHDVEIIMPRVTEYEFASQFNGMLLVNPFLGVSNAWQNDDIQNKMRCLETKLLYQTLTRGILS